MRKACAIVLIAAVAWLVSGNKACGQDSAARKWSLNGYVKDLQTNIFTNMNEKWITGNMIHNRLNFKYFPCTFFSTAVEVRNRLIYGDLVRLVPGFAAMTVSDDGLVKLSKNLAAHESWLLNSAVDRAWADFSTGKWQLTLGRQRINWGQTFVWNPNDLFNTYSFFDFDYEEKPGSDAARVQYFTGPASHAEAVVKGGSGSRLTSAAFYRFNRWEYDFQFFTGVYQSDDWAAGAGWSGQLAGGGFRGEISWFLPRRHTADTSGVVLATVGYDYTLDNSLFLQAEVLYNGNDRSIMDFGPAAAASGSLNAKNLFLDGFSCYAAASYPLTPLLNISLSLIANPENKMWFLVPTLGYSLADNVDFSLVGQFFQDYGRHAAIPSESFVFLRLRGSF